MKGKALSIKNMPRCPQCNSKATVGLVISYDNIRWGRAGKCYFCSNCLIEFDDKYVKIFNSNGDSIINTVI